MPPATTNLSLHNKLLYWMRAPWPRVWFTTVVAIVLTGIYSLINFMTVPHYNFVLPWDEMVPFMPWTILIYWSYYFMMWICAWHCSPPDFLKICKALTLTAILGWICFLLFTAHVPRPNVNAVEPAQVRNMYLFLHSMDPPGNSLPSLHVALSMLVGYRMWVQGGTILWPLWGILIAVSTLTTRQHVMADVVTGIVLAIVVYRWIYSEPRTAVQSVLT